MDSRKGSDDERRENEDEDAEGSLQTLGLAPYQFEPVAPANKSSPSDRSDEDDEGHVWRLNSTNRYGVTVSSTEIILLTHCFVHVANSCAFGFRSIIYYM